MKLVNEFKRHFSNQKQGLSLSSIDGAEEILRRQNYIDIMFTNMLNVILVTKDKTLILSYANTRVLILNKETKHNKLVSIETNPKG